MRTASTKQAQYRFRRSIIVVAAETLLVEKYGRSVAGAMSSEELGRLKAIEEAKPRPAVPIARIS